MTQAMPLSAFGVLLVCADHVEPLSVLLSTAPPAPAVKHVDDGQATAFSATVVPLVPGDQVEPTFDEVSAVPAAPTATHAAAEEHETPFSACVVPVVPADGAGEGEGTGRGGRVISRKGNHLAIFHTSVQPQFVSSF